MTFDSRSGTPRRGRPAALAYIAVLAAAVAGVVYVNFPGHMSWDSVSALHEGRFHARETWNPAIFGWLLGVLDRVSPNATAFIALSCALLFGSWMGMAAIGRRASWLAPLVAAGVVLLPQVSIYPAIYWKDVLFAETSIAAFVILAWGARNGLARTPWAALCSAAVLMAAAGLFRQNGLVFALFAAGALAIVGWRGGRLRSLALAGGWLVAVALLTLVFSMTLRPQGPGAPDAAGSKGLLLLQSYDVVGSVALAPNRPLPAMEAADADAVQALRTIGAKAYSPERVDSLSANPTVDQAIGDIPRRLYRTEWQRLVTHDPGLYLRIRTGVFRQVFATPIIDHCLPIEVGVEGPEQILKSLHITSRSDRRDQRLYNYTTWFLDTPAMSHVAYAVLALVVGVVLLVRRRPADLMMAAMQGAALAFTASFFVISIACDYRYLYVLDMTALTGLLYLSLDPRLRRA